MIQRFRKRYELTEGNGDKFTGLLIKVESDGIKLSQDGFAKKLVSEFDISDVRKANTPMSTTTLLGKRKEDEETVDSTMIRQAVGGLQYLVSGTRPDLSYAVQSVAHYVSDPGMSHWQAVKQILKFVESTSSQGIKFTKTADFKLETFHSLSAPIHTEV